jgi:PAS domain S-box-containing protein
LNQYLFLLTGTVSRCFRIRNIYLSAQQIVNTDDIRLKYFLHHKWQSRNLMGNREKLEELFGEMPYQTLVNDTRDFAIFHLDPQGVVISWNKGAENIFGYAADEIIGHSARVIFTPEDNALGIAEKELETAALTGRADNNRWHLRKDGTRFFANGITTALRNETGNLRGFAKIARDQTESKRIEDALEESNRRVNKILESITDAFFTLDRDWRFTFINRQGELLLARSGHELIGQNIWKEFPEAVGSAFYKQYHLAASESRSITFEAFYPPLETWFEVRAYPSSEGLSVYFHNINERRLAEEFQLEHSRIAALIVDIGNVLAQDYGATELLKQCAEILVKRLDAAFARIWTFNSDENVLQLQASAGLYTHLDGDHARIPIGKFKIGLIAEERVPHITNDVLNDPRLSDKKWAEREGIKAFAGYPLIVGERLVGVMCVFAKQDLTKAVFDAMAAVSNGIANGIERKRVEAKLRNSEEQYRIVAETASDAVISIDERSTILFINRAAERIFGYTIEEMIGNKISMLMPEHLRHLHAAGQQRYIKTGVRHVQWEHVEVPGLHRDGHEFPLEISFGEYLNNNRHIFIGIARDITERKRSESLLRQSEQQFSTLAETVPQLVWIADPDGSITWYNQNWYNYTGTTPEDMKGWGWQSVHSPEMLPSVIEKWKFSIENGEPFEMEFPLRGADGSFRWFLTRVNPQRDADGKIIRWFGTNTDVDEHRRLDLRNRFIMRLDESVRALETPEEITVTLARLLGEHLGVDRCAYAEVEADEDHFFIPADYTRGSVPSIIGHYSMSQFGAEVLRLMRADQPYVVDDVDNDERVSEADLAAYRLTNIQSVICVPLHKNNRFAACMAVHQTVPRHWTTEEMELVAFVANRFWESIERSRVVKSLHESLAREQEARQTAEQANKIKDEFLATVSHELRTPLNAILGWSNLLRNGKMDSQATTHAVEVIERNARSQSQLIDDLLDVSRIITGKLRLEIRSVELSSVIEAAVDAVRPAADAKNIRLQTFLDTKTATISGDAERLQQVVWNLLSNAVKFTPKNGRVQIKLERVNSHIEITVSDTGKGIEPEFLAYVFDRFRQADQTSSRAQGGLGLGLSIVRQLVEMHGGTVQVESEGENMGSSFIVNLPLSIASSHAENDEERIHPTLSKKFVSLDCAPELSGLRVLIVDDEADSRQLLGIILEECGSEVQSAASANEALHALSEERFDVLVSDIGMPEFDGYYLIERVRRLPAENNGRIPAVALTAYARIEDRVRALTSGFQVHAAKSRSSGGNGGNRCQSRQKVGKC